MSRVIFDVGANEGMEFIDDARNGDIVYAFEPTPELVSKILNDLRKNPCPSYHLIFAAVSDVEKIQKFNIAGWHEYGCSSLNEFSDGLEPLYRFTHSVYVHAIRLDTFVKTMNIETIDYLHVDTQGNDLKVLKSLGSEIHRVKSGVVEVPNTLMLYKNVPSKQETMDFLRDNKFDITKVENNYGNAAEQNIHFVRRD